MKDWEIARNPTIDATPLEYKAGQAGERLLLFELGQKAVTMEGYDATRFEDVVLEEVGRTLDPHVKRNKVPSLLQVKYNLAEEKNIGVEEVTLTNADERRKELMIETIPQQRLESIIETVIQKF